MGYVPNLSITNYDTISGTHNRVFKTVFKPKRFSNDLADLIKIFDLFSFVGQKNLLDISREM